MWPRFIAARAALLASLDGVTDEQAAWHPPSGDGEDGWSILEVARHVCAYSRNLATVIEGTARGESAPKDPPGTLAELPPGATLNELRRAIVEASARLATIHERVPAEPDLTTTVQHAFFGPLNCRAWYGFIRFHDTDHTRQIERLKATPGFPAATP